MAEYSIVECHEVEGSRTEDISLEAFSARVTLQCSYAARYNLVTDLLIGQRLWPHVPSTVAPVATACAIRSFGYPESGAVKEGQSLLAEDVQVDVTYSHDVKELISEEIRPSVEFQKLDHRMFKWSSGDPLLEPEAPGRQNHGLDFVRTYFLVTAIPSAVLTLFGKCNADSVVATTLNLTFPAETLLYREPAISRTISTQGADYYTLQIPFAYQAETWNKFWRAKTKSWEKIQYVDGSGDYDNFEPVDYTPIFDIPQAS